MFKLLIFIGLAANANNSLPTNIFCKAGNRGEFEQMYCSSSWTDISRLPLIEGRFQGCTSAFSKGTLVLRVGDSVLNVENPDFPFKVTLDEVDIICEEVNILY